MTGKRLDLQEHCVVGQSRIIFKRCFIFKYNFKLFFTDTDSYVYYNVSNLQILTVVFEFKGSITDQAHTTVE